MTRETKLGLGVTTSFLSLVAVVAYSSWKKTEAPLPGPDAPQPVAVAHVQPAAKNEPKAEAPVAPAVFNDGRGSPGSAEPSRLPALEPGAGAVPGGAVSVPVPPPGNEGIKAEGAVSPLNPAMTGQAPVGHAPTPKQSAIDIPPPGDVVVPSPAVTHPRVPASPPDSATPLPPLGEMTAKGPGAGDPKLEPGAASALPGAPLPISGNPPPGYPAPPQGMPLPANATPDASFPNPLPANPGAPPSSINPLGNNPTPPSASPASPGANPNPLPPSNPNALAPGGSPVSPPEPKQVGKGEWPGAQANAAQPKAPLGAGPVSEIGTQSNITSPPIAVPAGAPVPASAQAKPQVESFNERRYICQPTDTDFAVVSKQNYNSDKYGQALMLYNRDHPIGKAAVQQGLRLQPGAEVYVPPLYVLESRYGNAIPNLTPLSQNGQKSPDPSAPPKAMVPIVQGPPTGLTPALSTPGLTATAPVAPPAVTINNPQPLPAQPAVPNGSTNVAPGSMQNANPASAGPYKLYAVPAGGQQFYEIARDTLGDGRRWSEIYQLNQQYDPQLLVPAGTQLKLPPEAYVRQ
jgi:hypothetical protein